MRSMPGAIPPCGGAPIGGLGTCRRISPKHILAIAREREAFFIMSGRWFRIAPTKAPRHCRRFILKSLDAEDCFPSADQANKPSGSTFGIEKVVRKVDLLSSSFHSYIGKSTIQQNSKTSFFGEAEFVADLEPRRTGELAALSS